MQRYFWELVLVALITCFWPAASRGQAYTYFETFDNDTDTFTPPTTYTTSTSPAPGMPPAGWEDGRNAVLAPSNHIVEEVPSGYDGVATGPYGGANMGMVFGGGIWGGLPIPQPLGTVSIQIDFLSDLSRAKGFTGHSLLLQAGALPAPGEGSFNPQVVAAMGMYQVTEPSSGELRHTLYRWNTEGFAVPFFVLPAAPKWYTLEVIYKASDASDPATGLPRLAEVMNIYEQPYFENGFRRGQLVTSLQTDLTIVATPLIAPSFIGVASSNVQRRFQYIDNLAIGPPINTPEPSGVAAVLVSLVFLGSMRRRADKSS
jgi:hypothetical protein